MPGTGIGTGNTREQNKDFLMCSLHYSGEKQMMNKSININICKMSDGDHF